MGTTQGGKTPAPGRISHGGVPLRGLRTGGAGAPGSGLFGGLPAGTKCPGRTVRRHPGKLYFSGFWLSSALLRYFGAGERGALRLPGYGVVSEPSLPTPYCCRKVSKQLHTIGDFERIGDHAVNLWKAAEEIHEKDIHFSPQAEGELRTLTAALKEILDITTRAFSEDSLSLAKQVEPLEQVIDCLIADIKSNHIARLQNGQCTIEMGFVLSDILTNCERVSDHCSNIAVAQIETAQNTYQAHEYLNGVKNAAKINGEAANCTLTLDHIPVLGTIEPGTIVING